MVNLAATATPVGLTSKFQKKALVVLRFSNRQVGESKARGIDAMRFK
jgi:hypothetical protein